MIESFSEIFGENQNLSENGQGRSVSDKFRQLFAVIQSVKGVIALIDNKRRYLFANQEFQTWYGIDPGTLPGKHVREIMGEAAYENARPFIEQTLAGNPSNFEVQIPKTDGGYRHALVNTVPIFDDEDQVEAYGLVAQDITSKKEAEKALKKSISFNRAMIDSSQDCIKTLDLDGRLLSMSQGGQQLLEIDDISLFLNRSWIDFWQGEDHARARQAVSEAKDGRVGRFEGFCATTTGAPKWWDVILSPIYDDTGQICQLLSISRDITEKRQTDRQLQHRALELECLYGFSRMLETTNDVPSILSGLVQILSGVFSLDQPVTVTVNYKGRPYGSNHFDRSASVLAAEVIENDQPQGRIEVARGVPADGPVPPFSKEETALLHQVAKRLGKVLERLHKRRLYAGLFETLNEAILKADAEGVITEANPAAAELCGYDTPDELVGTPMKALYVEPETRETILARLAIEKGMFRNFEFLLKRKDGSTVSTLCNITMLTDDNGQFCGTLGALRDVTKRKAAENALRQSREALRASEENYRRLFDHSTSLVMEVDADSFEVINYNPAMAASLGQDWETSRFIGMDIRNILPETVLGNRILQGKRALEEGTVQCFEDERDGRYFLNQFIPVKKDGRRYIQTVSTDITEQKQTQHEREAMIKELQEALAQIKTLKGLLPICAYCKKIRDDNGYWRQLEEYLTEHSGAEFSHSICQQCAKEYYPDLNIYEK